MKDLFTALYIYHGNVVRLLLFSSRVPTFLFHLFLITFSNELFWETYLAQLRNRNSYFS